MPKQVSEVAIILSPSPGSILQIVHARIVASHQLKPYGPLPPLLFPAVLLNYGQLNSVSSSLFMAKSL